MTKVFFGKHASEFGLQVHCVGEDCPTVRHQGRMSMQGLKTFILIKILYQLKILLQKVWDHAPLPKKNK
jgi:hypothetical protein